jgi:hypothetical protein
MGKRIMTWKLRWVLGTPKTFFLNYNGEGRYDAKVSVKEGIRVGMIHPDVFELEIPGPKKIMGKYGDERALNEVLVARNLEPFPRGWYHIEPSL